MASITAATTALGKAFEQLFSWLKENKIHQSESVILKDKKNLEEAVNLAEEIIDIAFKYLRCYSEDDRAKLRKLKRKFDKKD